MPIEPKLIPFERADPNGAILVRPVRVSEGDVREFEPIPADDLREGQLLWESIDHPWIHKVDRGKFSENLESIRKMDPRLILSGHLPPASGMTPSLLETMAQTPDAAPYVGPDQAALDQILAQLSGSVGTDAST